MTDMVERVARAIFATRMAGHPWDKVPGFGWDDMTDAQRGDHHTLARAAIVHGEGYGRVKRVAT